MGKFVWEAIGMKMKKWAEGKEEFLSGCNRGQTGQKMLGCSNPVIKGEDWDLGHKWYETRRQMCHFATSVSPFFYQKVIILALSAVSI